MIISPGRRYVFVHIPKTGGTAMAAALEARAMGDDILIGDTEKARRRRGRVARLRGQAAGRLWKHATLADIDGVVTAQALQGMFCFCLVRNPWDRMVSYYHWLRAQRFDHPAVHVAASTEFAGFLADPQVQAGLRAFPYARYMRDATGRERGHFLRLEHLTEDMAPLVAHLGFTPRLEHLNRSERAADWRGYYDARSRALVAELCAEDVARFGYGFDG